jgi:hypothetical protein
MNLQHSINKGANMDGDDPFFRELERGESPIESGCTTTEMLRRNPPGLEEAIWQVRLLMDHAMTEVGDCIDIINNIMRWHGPDEIKQGLQRNDRGQLDLLARLRAVVDGPTRPAE